VIGRVRGGGKGNERITVDEKFQMPIRKQAIGEGWGKGKCPEVVKKRQTIRVG